MAVMTFDEKNKRIIARGEHSNHCHVLTGDVLFDKQGRIIVGENANVVLKHLLEREWLILHKEVWTGEHKDIKLAPGTYEYVPQKVFDPLSQRIEDVED